MSCIVGIWPPILKLVPVSFCVEFEGIYTKIIYQNSGNSIKKKNHNLEQEETTSVIQSNLRYHNLEQEETTSVIQSNLRYHNLEQEETTSVIQSNLTYHNLEQEETTSVIQSNLRYHNLGKEKVAFLGQNSDFGKHLIY